VTLPHNPLQAVEREVADTAAALRLSGLELADCVEAVGALGGDLTGGLRSTARLASNAESGLREGSQALGRMVRGQVVPVLAEQETRMRGEGWCSRWLCTVLRGCTSSQRSQPWNW